MYKNISIAFLVLFLAGYIVNDLKQDSNIAERSIERNIKAYFDESISSFQNDMYKKYSELYRQHQEDVYLLRNRIKSLENRLGVLESRPSINTGINVNN